MGYFSLMGTIVANSQQLKELHHHIADRGIQVASKDDLTSQLKEIERYLGRNDFSTMNRKRQTVNYLGGVLALPILVYGLLLLLDRFLWNLGIDINLEQINDTLIQIIIAYWPGWVLYLLLAIGMVCYYYWLSHLTVKAIQQITQQFMMRTTGHEPSSPQILR